MAHYPPGALAEPKIAQLDLRKVLSSTFSSADNLQLFQIVEKRVDEMDYNDDLASVISEDFPTNTEDQQRLFDGKVLYKEMDMHSNEPGSRNKKQLQEATTAYRKQNNIDAFKCPEKYELDAFGRLKTEMLGDDKKNYFTKHDLASLNPTGDRSIKFAIDDHLYSKDLLASLTWNY